MTDHPRTAHQLLTDYGLSEGVINGILDVHAHQLAEQQRAFLRSKGTIWTGSIGQVIDHIDPEVER